MAAVSRRTLPRARRGRPLLPLLVSLVLAVGIVLGLPVRAAADGPTTFSNTTSIAIPGAGGVPSPAGPASSYPSTVAVGGMAGLVTKVTATFSGLTHASVGDIDAMLVAPTGANLVLLSDLGDPVNPGDPNQLVIADNDTMTFDDAAGGRVPAQVDLPSGTFLPSNTNAGDVFAGSGQTPSTDTRLGDAFTGIDPNGDWRLFVVDDSEGEAGAMAGGWSLSITTAEAGVATTTTVTSSDTTSFTGDPVTFTATVTAPGGGPVASGTVQFRDGITDLGNPSPINGSGVATLTWSNLTEGDHQIRAAFLGATGFLASTSAPLAQRVDNKTIVTEDTFCNPGRITGPAGRGASTPYPSNIFVTGLAGRITNVTVSLRGVTHQTSIDFDVMLSAPDTTQNLFLLSDAGGNANAVSNADLTFDDTADGLVSAPITSGTYRPTRVADESAEEMPPPAPTAGSDNALSIFDEGNPNGTWSLWVVDDTAVDVGSISGGWCLTIEAEVETETELLAAPPSSIFNQSVDFTATVTADDDPVVDGSVRFSEGATVLDTVDLTADGTAVLPTALLSVGTHTITATYLGAEGFAESADDLVYVVGTRPTVTAVASSANPSDVGEAVTFTAKVTDASDPVTSGTVQFSIDGAPVGDPVAPNAAGQVTYVATDLEEGTYAVRATYSGTATLGTSVGDLEPDQQVNLLRPTGLLTADPGSAQVNQAVTFTATFTVDGAPATPGTVTFADGATTLCAAVAVDGNGTATCPTAFSTSGTHQIVATFPETATYAEETADLGYVVGLIPTMIVLGTSGSPSDVGDEVTFTAGVTADGSPVATGSVRFRDGGTLLGEQAVDARGVATFETASLAAGPHQIQAMYLENATYAGSDPDELEQVVNLIQSSTTVTTTPNPSDSGQDVTVTATVASSGAPGSPVPTGTVSFSIDGGPAVTDALDGSGAASISVDTLTPGAHDVVAVYGGDSTHATSSDTADHGVRPVAVSVRTYEVAEGGSLNLSGAGSTDAVLYGWDLDGDNDFDDATGETPSLTWAQLEALDVTDGPASHQVRLRVRLDDIPSEIVVATLSITNTAPASVLTGGLSATVGVPFTIKVGANDPSSADMAALFTYTVDWGDGSPVFTVVGPADPPVTHTYATAGEFEATFTATDKDGGTGPGTTVTVLAAAAPTASPTPNPNPTTGDPYDWDDDSDDSDSDPGSSLASTGSVVGLGTILAGILLLGAGGAVLIASRRRTGRREG